ncbi:MAG: hypothetical protein JXD18_10000 [Anaerolineae bacterium]|nr:hypothetical protein [Anaerolineae bacterium]
MFRFVIGFPLLMHGLAHMGGFLAAWVENLAGFDDQPWLYSKTVTLQSTVGRALSTMWLLSFLVFMGAGLGAVLRQEWWPLAAIIGAVISLDTIVMWWRAVPLGAKLGAAFDVLLLIALLPPWGKAVVSLFGQ